MKSLKSRIIFSSMITIVLIILIFEIIFMIGIREYYYGSIHRLLIDRANISAEFYDKYLPDSSLQYKGRYIIENYGDDEYCTLQILNKDGRIIESSSRFNSNKTIQTSDFISAINGQVDRYIGRDSETGEKILSISLPLSYGYGQTAVIRYITSIEEVDRVSDNLIFKIWIIGLLVLILALIVSFILARSIIRPVKELILVSEKMAKGDFSIRGSIEEKNEMGKLSDTLNYMADEIEKTNKIKNEFISSISHELRTPLTAIKGWNETLLSTEDEISEELQIGLQIISSETNRLIGLTEELLDFSKLESNKLTLYEEEFKLQNILREVANQYKHRAREKEVKIIVDIDDDLPEIQGDRNRLKQVFINILDNALKFSGMGSKIEVEVRQIQAMLLISFKDYGIGIKKEDLPKVKEKFYKGRSRVSGSGLGLSICNGIVELHGGRLEIESEYEKGTVVKIYLPFG
ncbi:MAG: HAMP domain-containing histidine kinase [Tissierellales bacterium]|nr:HAMP domain-containing histidine kinase [Tissierellales bacterium]